MVVGRVSGLDSAGWNAVAEALEGATALTCLDGYTSFAALRAGAVSELGLSGVDLGTVAARFAPRSASCLTKLELG